MITIYGIKTCGSVRKALKFCQENNLEFSFVDFRTIPLECEKIKYFASKADINLLFNSRGTKYKNLRLKELNLDDSGKLEWLCRENMLLKRPIVEYQEKVIVGFDEELYKKEFVK